MATVARVEGWVTNARSGSPLPGVSVRSSVTGLAAQTDDSGFFRLTIPVDPEPGRSPDRLPVEDELIFEHPGYASLVRSGVQLLPGRTTVRVAMEAGTGLRREPQLRGRGTGPRPRDRTAPALGAQSRATTSAAFLAPPASIRVGRNCSCASCSSVSVMSLETYVRGGLNNEWIASWNADSLRAGAVAYRSYGAWHVYHPRSPSYDICDTTCCQVYDSTTHSATDAAVDATAGILLRDPGSGEPAFAEYSAENNDLDGSNGCGDCYVGRPAHGWSCLYDEVGCGHALFGHGRGMSQWGSKRWGDPGRDRDWRWIADHYYNERTSPRWFLSSPIEITGVTASPTVVAPGQRFSVQVDGFNHAEVDHTAILLGASLCDSTCGISDPANDVLVTAATGPHTVGRPFDVPDGSPPGTYDLLVAYWYDVDGDAAVGAADLVLATRRLNAAVTVLAATPTPTPSATSLPSPTPTASPTPTVASAGCAPVPVPGCGVAAAGLLRLRDPGDPARQHLVWKWKRGDADRAAFGDPAGGDSTYRLCLYDDGRPVISLRVDPGSGWRSTRRGFRYRAPKDNASGVERVLLSAGSGKARIVVRARGEGLGTAMPLPLAQSAAVTVQLVREDSSGSACWEGIFAPPARRNDAERFQDVY